MAVSSRNSLRLPVRAWVLGCVGVGVTLAVWSLLAQALAGGGGVISRLPSPVGVAVKLVGYARTDLARDLVASLRVFGAGWLVGVVGATLVGLLLGRVRVLGRIFLPILEAMRPV
jgi:ABC-type nitrate/sulfonate/bicarbonate transport system permease component